jgi:hypothetical protein
MGRPAELATNHGLDSREWLTGAMPLECAGRRLASSTRIASGLELEQAGEQDAPHQPALVRSEWG